MTKEQDKQIAEMMGWEVGSNPYNPQGPEEWILGPKIRHLNTFHPTTDANDDHIVLKHIRENWDGSQLWIFDGFLIANLAERHPNERDIELFKYYEPGDYSRAALKVIDERTKTKSQ